MATRNHKTEQRDTFAQFTAALDKLENEHVILGGYYNVYVNPALDKMDGMGGNSDNGNFRLDLTTYLDVNNLVDVWRIAHPDTNFFTWHRGSKRARLYYIFISEHLLNSVDATDIRPGILSDHSFIKLSLSSKGDIARGKGFWKFNSSLLHDRNYVDNYKPIITESAEKYKNMSDKGLVWELIKLEIRNFTIPYCIDKKRKETAYENELNKHLRHYFE